MTLSLAGRTAQPAAQPVPVRIGGFGGTEGLVRYLNSERIDALIDATHPFAATISRHAAEGCAAARVPILAVRRAAWTAVPGDNWIETGDMAGAVRALGASPRRVFLTVGRNEVAAFEAAPQHHYLVRSVDPVDPPLNVPDAHYVVARGPFTETDEKMLLGEHRIETIVAKNSGGEATYAKIAAARALGSHGRRAAAAGAARRAGRGDHRGGRKLARSCAAVRDKSRRVDQRRTAGPFDHARERRADDDQRRHVGGGRIGRCQA